MYMYPIWELNVYHAIYQSKLSVVVATRENFLLLGDAFSHGLLEINTSYLHGSLLYYVSLLANRRVPCRP